MKNFFDNLAGIILVLFIIIYAIGFIQNSIETTKNIVDVWENGLPIFREGYIPPSKRKVEGVKFVPEGADPRDYIKDDWLAVVLTVYGFETRDRRAHT